MIIHGKHVVKRGNCFFVVRKKLDVAERIHAKQGGGDAGFDRQMTKPALKLRESRVTKHAHGPCITL